MQEKVDGLYGIVRKQCGGASPHIWNPLHQGHDLAAIETWLYSAPEFWEGRCQQYELETKMAKPFLS